jgi:hypothetical protein
MKGGLFRDNNNNCDQNGHDWFYYIERIEIRGQNPEWEEFTCCHECGLMLPFEGSVLENYFKMKHYNRTME